MCCERRFWAGLWQVLGLVRKVPLPAIPVKTRRFLRIVSERRFRHRDREALVVVAAPFDVGFEVDVRAGDVEAEEGRFALGGDQVVDRDQGDAAGRGEHEAEGGDRDAALADDRVERAGGVLVRSVASAHCVGRLRVDAEPDRKVDPDVLQRRAIGVLGSAFDDRLCLTMNWVKPTGG